MKDLEGFETCDFYVKKNPLLGATDYNIYSVTSNKLVGWMIPTEEGWDLRIMKYAIRYCGRERKYESFRN